MKIVKPTNWFIVSSQTQEYHICLKRAMSTSKSSLVGLYAWIWYNPPLWSIWCMNKLAYLAISTLLCSSHLVQPQSKSFYCKQFKKNIKIISYPTQLYDMIFTNLITYSVIFLKNLNLAFVFPTPFIYNKLQIIMFFFQKYRLSCLWQLRFGCHARPFRTSIEEGFILWTSFIQPLFYKVLSQPHSKMMGM